MQTRMHFETVFALVWRVVRIVSRSNSKRFNVWILTNIIAAIVYAQFAIRQRTSWKLYNLHIEMTSSNIIRFQSNIHIKYANECGFSVNYNWIRLSKWELCYVNDLKLRNRMQNRTVAHLTVFFIIVNYPAAKFHTINCTLFTM